MWKVTEEGINQEIIDKYVPINTPEREELLAKLKEFYQWGISFYNNINKGDFEELKSVVERHILKYV